MAETSHSVRSVLVIDNRTLSSVSETRLPTPRARGVTDSEIESASSAGCRRYRQSNTTTLSFTEESFPRTVTVLPVRTFCICEKSLMLIAQTILCICA